MTHQVFLLSPARCVGKRADLLLNDRAAFPLARQLREPEGAPLGDVFSFLSGLYFRGKLAYARAFARPPAGLSGALVISAGRGLLSVDRRVTIEDIRAFAKVPIEPDEPRYLEPLLADAVELAKRFTRRGAAVLLGSIATGKYCEPLLGVLSHRLHFPAEFAGRGDMSRGGLMLRCVDQQSELTYTPIATGVRRGSRPPKLPPARNAEIAKTAAE